MNRVLAFLLVALIAFPSLAWASGDNQTQETVPSSNTTFLTDLQNFLRKEDADRFRDGFYDFVIAGGTHATGAGLTWTPASLTGYANGQYVSETGAVTYAASKTQWVIFSPTRTGNLGTFTRVAGTHYLLDSASASKPSLPSTAAWLMQVVTNATDVTTVTDLRSRVPYAGTFLQAELPTAGPRGRIAFVRDVGSGVHFYDNGSSWTQITGMTNPMTTAGDIIYGGAAGAATRLAVGALTGQVLRVAAGNPAWGAVNLASADAVTGVLVVANGGTGVATLTSNGVVIGKGTAAVAVSAAGAANNVFRVPAAGGEPAFGTIALGSTNAVTGTLGTANGGTELTTAPDDYVILGDGTKWTASQVPNCAGASSALQYATATNTISCGTITGVSAATQAEMETGTSTTVYVSPGRAQFHQSASKGWGYWNLSGVLQASYNISSITDNGLGNWTVNWTTVFSSLNYTAIPGVYHTAGSDRGPYVGNMAAGSIRVRTLALGVETDPDTGALITAYGDQ